MKKVLIDTNVWLDIALDRVDFREESVGSIGICLSEGYEVCLSAASLKDVFYIVEKSSGAEKAYEFIETMLDTFSIAAVDETVCKNALPLERPDYEDGLIAAAAVTEKADVIITRDERAFADLGIERFTPKEFIAHMEYEEFEF